MPNPERELRELWTAQGVPKARQDQLIADITAKAQPGAMIGPFRINRFLVGQRVICQGYAGRIEAVPIGASDLYRVSYLFGTVMTAEQLLEPLRSEMTEAGEQTVIPGCERDDARTGEVQKSLF